MRPAAFVREVPCKTKRGLLQGEKVTLRWFPFRFHAKQSNTARAAFLLALFLCTSAGWLTALDPSHRISQYGHTLWRVQDGYFGGQPISITQTIDGYFWVGAESGIFRFDGVQFVSWNSLSG